MPTVIDSLSIEIESNSTGAASGIDALAASLGKLKKNGSVGVAVRNLKELSGALKNMTSAASNASKISSLADAMEKLKNVGSTGNGVKKMAESLQALKNIDFGALDMAANSGERFKSLASALSVLSEVKSGGIGTMVNGLARIGEVTKSLDDDTIARFAERVELLTEKVAPLSEKMTTLKVGFNAINSSARKAGNGAKSFGDKLDSSSINLSSFIHIMQSAVRWIQSAANKFAEFIADASEWEGISARFGRGFGAQARETYEWIKRLNQEMGINTQQFMQYSSTYATMLTGFGVAQEDASEMALGYMELTYDVWAGYNDIYKSLDDAAAAVRSAIAGEVEPVRKAGFTIIESTLEQTAANHGLKISLENATEAQKSYLRYLTLVDQAQSQNLVGTYAKEMNTAEGVMRTFNQQLKSLAQSFGSLLLPVLVKVMPYVQAFVDLMKDGVYWTASLFGVEIQAVDFSGYESGIDGVTDSFDDATESAKEFKRATLGIDELNILSSSADSSTTGGAAFEGLDVGSLWDETIFDSIQDQVGELKGTVKETLDTVLAIAAGLLTWTISTSLIKNATDIAKAFKDAKAHFGELVSVKKTIGISLMVTGIALEYQGLKAIFSGEGDWKDAVKAALGAAFAVGGSLLFFGTNPVGWAVGIGLALTTTIVAWTVAQKEKFRIENSEFFKRLQEYKDKADELAEFSTRLKVTIEEMDIEYASIDSDFEGVRDMIDRIFELDAIENKTADELAELKSYVDIVNGLKLDGLCLHFDEATGKIKETKDAVYDVIDSLIAQAKIEAAHENLVELYKQRYEATMKLTDSQELLKQAAKDATESQAAYDTAWAEAQERARKGDNTAMFSQNLRNLKEKAEEAAAAHKELSDKVKGLQGDVVLIDEKIGYYASETANLTEDLTNLNNKLGSTRTAFDNAARSVDGYANSLKNIPTGVGNIHLTAGVTATTFASGGFPSSGEVFLARENGIPEMVGRMGNRTTVANNAQIVDGIASGVASANEGVVNAVYAMASMIVKAVEDKDNNVYLGGKQLARALAPYSAEVSRAKGSSLVSRG